MADQRSSCSAAKWHCDFFFVTTIRTYFNVAEAGFAQSLLESRGIQAFLHGENSYTMESVAALGGIRLQVPDAQVEEAQGMLAGEGFAPLPDNFVPPATDSDEVEHPSS